MQENQEIIEELYARIESLKDNKEITVVAIAGAGCIGKTTLANRLSSYIYPFRVTIINLDGYMLEREEAYKIEEGMTGYDPRRNNLDKAQVEITRLVNNRIPFEQRDYDRSTHQRTQPDLVQPKPFVIIDGVHALNGRFRGLVDFGIYVDATEETQFNLRLRREQKEFNYTTKDVKKRWKKYWPDYKNHVAPQRNYADIVLYTDEGYKLRG